MSWAPQRFITLAQLTTLQVGGEAEYFTAVSTETELKKAWQWAKEEDVQITVIAGGSNVLVSDEGVSGLVIQMNTKGRQYEDGASGHVLATFQAGEVLDEVISETVAKGLWGLENLSGIPGSVGATPIQNVGAYGVEVSDIIHSVSVFDTKTGRTAIWSVEDCLFSYRNSFFKNCKGRYVILAVTFLLTTNDNPKLDYKDLANLKQEDFVTQSDIRKKVLKVRGRKFPDWTTVGTAGSFFKNPIVSKVKLQEMQRLYPNLPFHQAAENYYKIPLGWILDQVCNLRGYSKKNLSLYKQQALVLVNYGNSTAKEVVDFATEIQDKVRKKTGLEIEYEVTRLPSTSLSK